MAVNMESKVLETTTGAATKAGSGIASKAFGAALDVGGAAFSYNSYKKDGDSTASAAIKSAGGLAIDMLLPWQVQIPMTIAVMGAQAIPGVMQTARETAQVGEAASFGSFDGGYQLSENAATMRQAGVEAIEQSGHNLRSTLGSEARMYSR